MSTALYRRYRPENFAEVIGQEHVTAPLMQALRSNRVNHAYLFSGPRGCGKTTSARILARILNCAANTPETPTDTPCGGCESCIELARGGPGSLDVVEIDAASHGGVDDARELRERATFSPSRDRFKIFILDEAHMVTAQGFNALLKIVEEPPEYLKFIFATTEPEKVIGTIRSRTHHYPFRLVAPDTLQTYLAELSASEGIQVGAGVLPLVVRAGGGSVRDSLSVLDQLMAGAERSTLDYERAVSLLGFTHVTLLDDVVDALAARDGATMFRVVDHVVATGHEPRRFVEDLLERLRDLIVLSVSGESAQAVLRSVPEDQLARMQQQADNLGAAELSRSADVVNAALTEMSGATSPRLHLELLCARLLLPAVDDTVSGVAARLDRLERGAGGPVARAAAVAAPVTRTEAAPVVSESAVSAPAPSPTTQAVPVEAAPVDAVPMSDPEPSPGAIPPWEDLPDAAATAPAAPGVTSAEPVTPTPPMTPAAPVVAAEPAVATHPAAAAQPARASGQVASTEMLRHRWDEVLETLSRLKKSTWILVKHNAQVAELTSTTLRLTFASPGLATTFRTGPGAELVQRAVRETLGFDVRVEGGVDEPGRSPAPVASSAPKSTDRPAVQGIDPVAAAASWDEPAPVRSPPADKTGTGGGVVPGDGTTPSSQAPTRSIASIPEFGEEPPADYDEGGAPYDDPGFTSGGSRSNTPSQRSQAAAPQPSAPQPAAPQAPAQVSAAAETPRQAAERQAARTRAEEVARAQVVDDPQPDDEDLMSSTLIGAPLVAQLLGGVVIDEIRDGEG